MPPRFCRIKSRRREMPFTRRYAPGFAAIAVWFAGNLQAQTPPPDIGTNLREMERERPATPPPPTRSLEIEQPAPAPLESAAETQIPVTRIRITGSTAYPARQLEALVSQFGGHNASVSEL